MPRVPSIRPQGPASGRVTAGNVQPVQSGAGAQGAQLGEATLRAGAAAVSIGNHLQQQFDLARAKEADNLASDVFRENMGSYLQLQGKDATGDKRRETFDTIRARLDVIGRSLGTPTQRAMFREQADARMQDALFKADAHEAKQVFVYEMSESEARVKAFAQDALRAAPGSDEFDFYHGSMLREVDGIADKMGWPKDSQQRQQARLDTTTKLHAQAINQLLNSQQVAAAQRHRQDYADEIAPEQAKAIDKVLQTAVEQERAQTMLQEFTSQGLGALQILDEANTQFANKKLSVGERDELVRRAAAQETFVLAAQERVATQVFEAAKNAALQGQPLTPQFREALARVNKLDDYMEWLPNKAHKTTSAGLLLKAQSQDDPEGFFSMFVEADSTPSWDSVFHAMRDEMDDKDLEILHDRWRVWRGLEPMDAVQLDVDQKVTKMLFDLGPEQGGLPENFYDRKATDAEKNLVARIRLELEQSVLSHTKGRKAVAKDYDEAMDRMVKNRLKARGTSRPLATTTEEQLRGGWFSDGAVWETEFGDIPADHHYLKPENVEIIRQALVADGVRVEDVDELMIATEAARRIQEVNATNVQQKATDLAKGGELLRRLYTTLSARRLDEAVRQNEEWTRMQEATGLEPQLNPLPTAAQLHKQVRDELLDGTWGRKLATQYGLTIAQMEEILDKRPPAAPPRFNAFGVLPGF